MVRRLALPGRVTSFTTIQQYTGSKRDSVLQWKSDYDLYGTFDYKYIKEMDDRAARAATKPHSGNILLLRQAEDVVVASLEDDPSLFNCELRKIVAQKIGRLWSCSSISEMVRE